MFIVTKIKDLNDVIIPHFIKYPLVTQKQADFELFRLVVEIIKNKEHLTEQGLVKLVSIRASINLGLSATLMNAFPNVLKLNRPLIKLTDLDLNWFAGFVDGEGCFSINISTSLNSKLGYAVSLSFSISQNIRDTELMYNIAKNLNCGSTYKNTSNNAFSFVVSKLSDITEKLIPLFKEYPLHGVKRLDFEDFCRTAELIKNKTHLTAEGLEFIRGVKSGMNKGRYNYKPS